MVVSGQEVNLPSNILGRNARQYVTAGKDRRLRLCTLSGRARHASGGDAGSSPVTGMRGPGNTGRFKG